MEDKFILKTGSSLFPKICRSYFLFTPHGLGDFLDQFELVPLFQLGQLVADLTGGKAALWTQAKTVERDILFCLMDAGDYSIFVLQTGRFGRYKTQHHLFAICNILQRLKAAGARIVKFFDSTNKIGVLKYQGAFAAYPRSTNWAAVFHSPLDISPSLFFGLIAERPTIPYSK